MKKFSALMLAAALVLSLAACGGKSDAAKAVDEQIAAIGEVTLESESKIAAAEDAAAALQEEDKKQLDNLESLTEARAAYDSLVLEAEADEIEAAISAIGTVTLESGDSISSAENAYMGASAEVQALVENAAVLDEAKATLSELRVVKVDEMISAIGEVTIERSDAVREAQKIYDALSTDDKGKVKGVDVLEAAMAKLAELEKAAGEAALQKLNTSYDQVQKLTWYEHKNQPRYTDITCYIYPYIGRMDGGYTWLRVALNYTDAKTDAGWIFFDHVIFSIDGHNTTKNFSRNEIVRDNDTEVWEVADFEPTASEIQLLKDIANSTETIIRFEGKEYYEDHTVTNKEKTAILDVLAAYDYLSNLSE